MKLYKPSPPSVTVLENGTVRTADDLFHEDIGAVEIINVPRQNGGHEDFYSLLSRRIVRRDVNFVALKLFYLGHRKSLSETFSALLDEVQVRAAIQTHLRPRVFRSTPFGFSIDCPTRKLPAQGTHKLDVRKGVGL